MINPYELEKFDKSICYDNIPNYKGLYFISSFPRRFKRKLLVTCHGDEF